MSKRRSILSFWGAKWLEKMTTHVAERSFVALRRCVPGGGAEHVLQGDLLQPGPRRLGRFRCDVYVCAWPPPRRHCRGHGASGLVAGIVVFILIAARVPIVDLLAKLVVDAATTDADKRGVVDAATAEADKRGPCRRSPQRCAHNRISRGAPCWM